MTPRHEVCWKPDEVEAPVRLAPMILGLRQLDILLDATRDGVADAWDRQLVTFYLGSRLAWERVFEHWGSPSAPVVRELGPEAYRTLRRKLIRERGSRPQREFLASLADRASVLEFFSRVPTRGVDAAALVPHRLGERDFIDAPPEAQRLRYGIWKGVGQRAAARSSFWAHLTLEHIRAGRIEPSYLAAPHSPGGGSGARRIQRALGEGDPKGMDDCVRAALRRLGGLPEARGKRSVYVDCPFSRGWWRELFVEESGTGDPVQERGIRDLLSISKAYWEKLIDNVVRHASPLASRHVRSSWIRALAQSSPASGARRPATLHALCGRIEAHQENRELGVFSPAELDLFMEGVLRGDRYRD